MEILGVGLSRTGTTSLTDALSILGYKCLHYGPEYINLKSGFISSYDEFDAVTDIPAAWYYKEIGKLYPNLKYVLTIRDIDKWFISLKRHYSNIISRIRSLNEPERKKDWLITYAKELQKIVYGSEDIDEKLYKDRYEQHNYEVIETIPKSRLLIINICNGDGWEILCGFLDKKKPETIFPWSNKS